MAINVPASCLGMRSFYSHTMAGLCLCMALASVAHSEELAALPQDLTAISLESLGDIQVTSVSKRAERLSGAAAAVYVLTGEEIRRSGARNLPEALRLVPGLTVARINAFQWAVAARGFNGSASDKLEVLMDGRSLYTPLFSGVFWDAQDTLLDDIDRIEIIRGPGAALWGANAVNGVINIVTKSAKDTEGGIAEGTAGNEFNGGSARYGGKMGESGYWRAYAKSSSYDDQQLKSGGNANDDWRMRQGGFRTDWQQNANDAFTVQGDLYDGSITNGAGTDTSGGNLVSRWSHRLSDTASTTLQLYYDHYERDESGSFLEKIDMYDIDFQHNFQLTDRQEIVWGAGYRLAREDSIGRTVVLNFVPARRSMPTYSLFIQDQVKVIPDRLQLTVGSKFEDNDFTGFEVQPSLRLAYTPDETHTIWGGISRAIRIPNRVDSDLQAPPFIVGDRDFKAETAIAYELGYRVQPKDNLSLDIAAYFNDYDRLRGIDASAPPVRFSNEGKGSGSGIETSIQWKPNAKLRLYGGYNYQHLDLHSKPGSTDTTTFPSANGSDPHHQLFVRSAWDLAPDWTLDGTLRHVSKLKTGDVPAYTELNLRLAWQYSPQLEFALTGDNLLHSSHLEFAYATPTEIQRSILGTLTWRFQ